MRKAIQRTIIAVLAALGIPGALETIGVSPDQAAGMMETLAMTVAFLLVFAADALVDAIRGDDSDEVGGAR